MSAVLTPRVRTLVICDGIRASKTEDGVFHLRGARSHALADAYPFYRRLELFLVLSSSRPGRYPSYVKVVDSESDRAVYYGQIDQTPSFTNAVDLLTLHVPIYVRFPRPGGYVLQLWFFQEASADVLKMEQPFDIFSSE